MRSPQDVAAVCDQCGKQFMTGKTMARRQCSTACRQRHRDKRNWESLERQTRPSESKPPCSVEDCETPRRKLEWCANHYSKWRTHGDPNISKFTVPPPAAACVLCGATPLMHGSRSYCSTACRQAEYRSRANRWQQENRKCAGCSRPLEVSRINGRQTASSLRRFCDDCRSRPRRSYRLAVHILAYFQGTKCAVCREEIDMTVRFPDRNSASVDHIVPLARGGAEEDVANLQLAHFGCNSSKKISLISGEVF